MRFGIVTHNPGVPEHLGQRQTLRGVVLEKLG